MKLDVRPDDLILNRNDVKVGTYANSVGTKFYAVGAVRATRVLDMTSSAVVNNGTSTVIEMLEFKTSDTPYVEWVILRAFLSIKGFTGGSGAVSAVMGTNSATWNDMINTAVSQTPGGAAVVRGVLDADYGSRLASGGVAKYFTPTPGTDFIKILVDATAHTGTVTGGTITASLLMLPINGFT